MDVFVILAHHVVLDVDRFDVFCLHLPNDFADIILGSFQDRHERSMPRRTVWA